MYLADLGDAMVETKQLAPGTKSDSLYVFGIRSGSAEEDPELWQWMLAREEEP